MPGSQQPRSPRRKAPSTTLDYCSQIVEERLGHGSITTTEQYLGTLPGAGEAASSALFLRRSDAGRGTMTTRTLSA